MDIEAPVQQENIQARIYSFITIPEISETTVSIEASPSHGSTSVSPADERLGSAVSGKASPEPLVITAPSISTELSTVDHTQYPVNTHAAHTSVSTNGTNEQLGTQPPKPARLTNNGGGRRKKKKTPPTLAKSGHPVYIMGIPDVQYGFAAEESNPEICTEHTIRVPDTTHRPLDLESNVLCSHHTTHLQEPSSLVPKPYKSSVKLLSWSSESPIVHRTESREDRRGDHGPPTDMSLSRKNEPNDRTSGVITRSMTRSFCFGSSSEERLENVSDIRIRIATEDPVDVETVSLDTRETTTHVTTTSHTHLSSSRNTCKRSRKNLPIDNDHWESGTMHADPNVYGYDASVGKHRKQREKFDKVSPVKSLLLERDNLDGSYGSKVLNLQVLGCFLGDLDSDMAMEFDGVYKERLWYHDTNHKVALSLSTTPLSGAAAWTKWWKYSFERSSLGMDGFAEQ